MLLYTDAKAEQLVRELDHGEAYSFQSPSGVWEMEVQTNLSGEESFPGNWNITEQGKEWITSSEMEILPVATGTTGSASRSGSAHLLRLRARRDGTGSIALGCRSWQDNKKEKPIEDAQSWRTVAVDYSAKSGAPAVIMMVDGAYGFSPRRQVSRLQLAPTITVGDIEVVGGTFTVSNPESTRKLYGTILYPPTTALSVNASPDGRGPVISAYPDGLIQDVSQAVAGLIDTENPLAPPVATPEPIILDAAEEDSIKAGKKRRKDWAEAILEKLYLHTSSSKMGAPDRAGRASGNVVWLLVWSESEPPKVKPGTPADTYWFKLGDQEVTYNEWLVEFAK